MNSGIPLDYSTTYRHHGMICLAHVFGLTEPFKSFTTILYDDPKGVKNGSNRGSRNYQFNEKRLEYFKNNFCMPPLVGSLCCEC